ncbi:DUF898 family protein [Anaerorhabdus furcosa]|uniref:DUF898 domain-containing protein n=1 Tax=Anaerorhabdus furcosa TaxID=118967 RepID=A0A1T4LFB6_9FIRM|nr:DUF898 family protein [Anaerorhabdus furcosa]SJZ53164.1 protein of unknown function [Anaerorhabdus furcosa]
MTSLNKRESYFDGSLLGLVGINIITVLLAVITIGIAYPWIICIKLRWVASHTVIEGKRLAFIGTGLDLFWTWLVWLLLTLVTFGIYAFWVVIKMKQWEVKNTVFEEIE